MLRFIVALCGAVLRFILALCGAELRVHMRLGVYLCMHSCEFVSEERPACLWIRRRGRSSTAQTLAQMDAPHTPLEPFYNLCRFSIVSAACLQSLQLCYRLCSFSIVSAAFL